MLEAISGIITTVAEAIASVFQSIVGSITGGADETPAL